MDNVLNYSLPRWRFTQWLVHCGDNVPIDIRTALIASLFGTLPIFAGGVINTLMVSGFIALRRPDPVFIWWFVMEVILGLIRVTFLISATRAARAGRATHTDYYIILALLWAFSVGYGVMVTYLSGDWVAATLAGVSSAAMAGGICFRNYGAPRLVGAMIFLSMGPMVWATFFAGEPILFIALIQIPFYLLSMSNASYRLNHILVATMLAERENDRRASQDALTGLANRTGLNYALERKCNRVRAGVTSVGLLYMDLDDFKIVNDTYGHPAGDQVLKVVADRLRQSLRTDDMAARIGGDEFVVLAEGMDRNSAMRFADRMIRDVTQPILLHGKTFVTVGISVGIALIPEHGLDNRSLFTTADRALYDAKSLGGNCCAIAPIDGKPVETLCHDEAQTAASVV
ncbi:GGDEF domain-containing protein [Alcaligenaceae bacterium B3P038]|nr:GGDEF domain-containing protein [Alcaligenaceae bacterium B3P038]